MKRKVRICVVVRRDGAYSAIGWSVNESGHATDQQLRQDALKFTEAMDCVNVSWLEAEVPMPGPPRTIEATLTQELTND